MAFAGFQHAHILGLYHSAQKAPGVRITGCLERDAAVRQHLSSRGMNFCYDTYEELLNDPAVEVVAIGEFFAARGQMVIDALRSGKHVLCDKPLCTALSELDEIEALCTERQLQVGCMLDLRYIPQVRQARLLIEAGQLGAVQIVSFTGQHCLNYAVRPSWYFEPGKHGGTLNDLGIHGIDAVRFLTGKELTHIDCATTWNAFAVQAPQFCDCAMFMARMEGIAVMGDVSYSAPAYSGTLPSYWEFRIWGSDGMLEFNWQTPEVRVYRKTRSVYLCNPCMETFLSDFQKQIAGGQTVLNTESLLRSQRQTLLLQRFADDKKQED